MGIGRPRGRKPGGRWRGGSPTRSFEWYHFQVRARARSEDTAIPKSVNNESSFGATCQQSNLSNQLVKECEQALENSFAKAKHHLIIMLDLIRSTSWTL